MRDAIVAEARSWLGTPFHWQASAKGKGCDCKGLVWGVARELGRPEADSLHANMASYGPAVDVRLLKAGLAATFDKRTDALPGDVLLLKVGGRAQHLAILTGKTMVHTYGRGPRCVVEVPFTNIWRSQLDSVWGWRGVE